jgi:hypothetical protein
MEKLLEDPCEARSLYGQKMIPVYCGRVLLYGYWPDFSSCARELQYAEFQEGDIRYRLCIVQLRIPKDGMAFYVLMNNVLTGCPVIKVDSMAVAIEMFKKACLSQIANPMESLVGGTSLLRGIVGGMKKRDR